MKTLRLVKFSPAQNVASRYWEEDGFRRNDEIQISTLTAEQQAIVAGALAWAVSQLPQGFETLESVELRRVKDVVIEWSTPEIEGADPQPLATCPAFVACVVGNGELGQRAVEINSVPGPEFSALGLLWDQLSQ